MKELFPAKDMKMISPRLKWMSRNGIVVTHLPKNGVGYRWTAEVKSPTSRQRGHIGAGPTAEEACRDLGVKISLPLWNEVP
jgi:hypothetical protein